MFSDEGIPTLAQHGKWMVTEIESTRSVYFIGELSDRPIGFVRFADARFSRDMSDALVGYRGLWFASLVVDADFRGRGIGSEMFRLAEDAFVQAHHTRPLTLMTWARSDNPASWRVFEAVGWRRCIISGFREVVMRVVG
jgi:RimJ/RimL family protein N-acetyltransferase